jgi:hypothetical protein
MRQNNSTRKSVLYLLALVLVLHFVSAAPQITSVAGKGTDNLYGIIRSTDAITFEALITNDGNPVDPARVRLGSSIFFTSCTPLSSGEYLCTVRDPPSGTASFIPDEAIPFEVSFLTSSNTIAAVKSSRVLVDSREPAVGFSSASPQIAAREDITFDYVITDTACGSAECQNNCSGIKSVEFFYFQNGAKQVVQTQNPNTRACTNNSRVTFPSSTFPEGPNALYLQATDMVDQLSPVNSIPFTVDNSGPAIQDSTFSLKLKGKELYHYRTGATTPVVITLQIVDEQLNTNSVVADFSALNSGDSTLRQARPSCTSVSTGVWNCTWNVNMLLSSSGPKQFTVNASDVEGNGASSTLVRSFSQDDTGPAITSFTAGNANFATPVSTITGTLVESGSGVIPSEMLLSVSGQTMPASSCDAISCVWTSVSMGMGNVTVALSSSSTDILGNLAPSFSQGFFVTLTPPGINNVTIVGVGGLTNAIAEFIATGDRIAITANVTEETSIASALADVSQFIPGVTALEGQCSYSAGNSFTCSWLTEPVQNAVAGTITLSLRNPAGNVMNRSVALRTYSTDNNATPNYWMSTVSCTPSVLDRLLGPLINQKSYCTVKLEPRSPSQQLQTISMELAGCTGDTTSLLQAAELFNTQAGSTTPLIKLTLAKNDLKIDEIRTTCTVNIFSKVDNALTRVPEEEQVFVTLQFFNNPLGTVDEAAQSKLDKALKSTEGLQGFIGTLKTTMYYAEQVCKWLNAYYSIVEGLYSLVKLIDPKKEVLCAAANTKPWLLPPCKALERSTGMICNTQQGSEAFADTSLIGGANKLCKFVSCEWTPTIINLAGDKVTEIFSELPGLEGIYQKSTAVNAGNEKANLLGMRISDLSGFPYSVKGSLTTSVLFGCIPGIIDHLDKYRQINCLYADCIQVAVMEDNVPLKVCEDLKAEATCKYVVGEVFAVVPYTALFDSVMNQIKGILSNPLSAVSGAFTAYCWGVCGTPQAATNFGGRYEICAKFKLIAKIGYMVEQVAGIIQQGFLPPKPADYCQVVKDRQEGNGENKGLFGGLFK